MTTALRKRIEELKREASTLISDVATAEHKLKKIEGLSRIAILAGLTVRPISNMRRL
jgi:hypothetical protein